MRQFLRAFVLLVAVATLTTTMQVTSLPGQTKEKEKEKKDPKVVPEETGSTEVYMGKDGWRFRVKNAEGKSVAVGTISFEKKEECLKAVEVVKTALVKGKVVELKEEKKP
jgi:uncharacterized protein YegP (UPF0339 family)